MRHTVRTTVLALLAIVGISTSAFAATASDTPISIILIGDSYLVSWGVAPSEGFAARLGAALNTGGRSINIIDTGLTGYSSDGVRWLKGVSRVAQKLFASPANNAVILELGSNDCGEPELDQTRANLDKMLARFAEVHVPVLVVGTHSYSICEHFTRPTYPTEYFQMFADLAAKYGDLYYPDFKEGVSDHPELMHPDGDHPNAQGDAVIVAKMLPVVRALIARTVQP